MEFSKKSERQSKQLKTSKNKGSGFSLEDNRSTIAQLKPNKTGLPDNLKSGIENMSGHSMDDVRVHYNSSKPAQYQAHAYAQGSQIHLASGQEKHLPHEAWHVVQQKQGRVKPTMQMNGGAINDDPSLEKEADVMGGKAIQLKLNNPKNKSSKGNYTGGDTFQLMKASERNNLDRRQYDRMVFNRISPSGIYLYTMHNVYDRYYNVQVHYHPDTDWWSVRWVGENHGNQNAPQWVIVWAISQQAVTPREKKQKVPDFSNMPTLDDAYNKKGPPGGGGGPSGSSGGSASAAVAAS